MKEKIEMPRGRYKIIRVDGTEIVRPNRPSIQKIQQEIGCECCDTITLRRDPPIVMIVDDTGMVDHKPVNPKATELARAVFGPEYLYSIHGDVAIVNDEDFA